MCSLLSRVLLFVTPWTVTCQAPLSMKFSRQEYWTGLPFPFPGDLLNPRIKPQSPALQADYHLSHRGRWLRRLRICFAVQETRVWSLAQEDHLEKGTTNHSSILTWRISWTEEPGGLQSMGSQRIGHDWATKATTKFRKLLDSSIDPLKANLEREV